MNLQQIANQATVSHRRPDEAALQLDGRRLVLARAIWLALIIPSLGLFVIATILCVPRLIGPDKALRALMLHLDPTASGNTVNYSHYFDQFGSYFTLSVFLSSLAPLVWIAVGLVLFWRKSDNRMGLFASFGLMLSGPAVSPQFYLLYVLSDTHVLWRWSINFVVMLGWGGFGLMLLLFPNGRFSPRWIRWVVPLYLVFLICWGLPSNIPFSTLQWPGLLLNAVKVGLLTAGVSAQLYRYQYKSNLIERQQTKWVVFAIVITLLVDISSIYHPGLSGSVYAFISTVLYILIVYILPLAIGVAVLRYRLWDIDLLINRTWVYGTLTISLSLVYFGLVISLQSLVRLVTGQTLQSPVVIVASTLVIYALFQPLRLRIQRIIDRRFYRRKYDADRTLAAFRATLSQEVDLDRLGADLVAVIEETMQPTFVSLWVRPVEHDENHRISWKANPPGSGFREGEKIQG